MPSQVYVDNPLILVTNTVTGNEKAWTYLEVNLQSPGSRGRRRYRIIVVNRDGKLAEYREDMGATSKFRGKRELNIPSFWEHDVDELLVLAEELRNEKILDLDELLQLDSNQYRLG